MCVHIVCSMWVNVLGSFGRQVSLSKFESREVEVLRQLQPPGQEEHHTPMLYGIVLQGDVVFIFMEFIGTTDARLNNRSFFYFCSINLM